MAMRDSAALASPCEPVTRQTTSCAGKIGTSLSLIVTPDCRCRWPRRWAITEFSFMPRPTNATLRSNCAARSATICSRYRLDENVATTILPSVLVKISSKPSSTSILRAGVAAAIDVGAVAEHRQHALGAQLREAVQVERLAVHRRLVDLEVAGVQQHALRRADHHGDAVGHAVRDADELQREGADGDDVAGLDGHGLAARARAPRASCRRRPAPAAVP